MERTFRSKTDLWYHFLLWGDAALVLYCFWYRHIGWAVTTLIVAVFLMESLLRTDYVFGRDGFLTVRCGFLPRYRVPVGAISEIRYINSMRPAYALSAERLLLITEYGTREVSPQNREEFVKEVRRHNQHLIVVR